MADRGAPDGYQEVPQRIEQFYAAYPDGRLSSRVWFEVLPVPRVIDVPNRKDGDKVEAGGPGSDMVTVGKRSMQDHSVFVICEAKAYRTPDDPTPCVGIAAEPFPGTTPYTKDSEVMNAETSAWGRALVATGVTRAKVIASANEVRNRRGEAQETPRPARRAARPRPPAEVKDEAPVTYGEDTEPPGDPSADQGIPPAPYEGPALDADAGLPDTFATGAPPEAPPGVDPETGDTGLIERQRERVLKLLSDLAEDQQAKLRKAWKEAKLPKPAELTYTEEFDEAERLIGEMWGSGWANG